MVTLLLSPNLRYLGQVLEKCGVRITEDWRCVERSEVLLLLQDLYPLEEVLRERRENTILIVYEDRYLEKLGVEVVERRVRRVRVGPHYLKTFLGTHVLRGGESILTSEEGHTYGVLLQSERTVVLALRPLYLDLTLCTEDFLHDLTLLLHTCTPHLTPQVDLNQLVTELRRRIAEERRRNYFSKTARGLELLLSGDTSSVDAETLEYLAELGLVEVVESEEGCKIIPRQDLLREVVRHLEQEGYL